VTAETFSNMHREFINGIADQLTDAEGASVDPASIVPYSYRHIAMRNVMPTTALLPTSFAT